MSLVDQLDGIFHNWEKCQHRYPAHVKVEKLEIVQSSRNDFKCTEKEIGVSERDALAEWLGVDDDSAPALKLLLICTKNLDEANFDSNEEDTKAVTEAFQAARLPLGGLIGYSSLIFSSTKAPLRYVNKDGKTSLLSRYYFTTVHWCITWTYDHATKNTRGALVYPLVSNSRNHFVKALTSNARYIDQPMLLGLLGSKISLHETEVQHRWFNNSMWAIRDDTGLFTWDEKTGNLVQVDSSRLNYGTISRELGSLSARVNNQQFWVCKILSFATMMLQEHLKSCQGSRSGQDVARLLQEEDVKEAIEIVKEQAALLLSENQTMTEALTNMMSAIYNLIAQKDSNVGLRLANHSRTLAIESKRDSSSMKTIATVTMAFLPGTFVSSFFAMPMFDWNKPPGDNVNSRTFWIYWAVTVPLTVSVFLLWGVWFRFKNAREAKEDKLLAEQDMLDEKRNDGESDEGYDSRSRSISNPRRTRPRGWRDSTAASFASQYSRSSRTYSPSPASSIRTPQHGRILVPDATTVPLPPSVGSLSTSSASVSSKSLAMAPPLPPLCPGPTSVSSLHDLTAVGLTERDRRPPSLQLDSDITQSEVQRFSALQPPITRRSMIHPPATTPPLQQPVPVQPPVKGRSATSKSMFVS